MLYRISGDWRTNAPLPVPFVGAVELAPLAKAKNVISDAWLGLGDICAAVLHQSLDKSNPVCLGSNWNCPTLSDEQIQYASQDAYASLQIYLWLSKMTTSALVLDSALPGTPIFVHHDDGKLISHGILSQEAETTSWLGVNLTKTRAWITVQQNLVPAAVLPLHNKSLAEFGTTPFDVVVKHSMLRTYLNTDVSSTPPEHAPEAQDPTAASNSAILEPDVLEFLSKPVSAEDDWVEDVDDPVDITNEDDRDMQEAELDELSVHEGLKSLPKPPSAWSPFICS